MRVSGNAPLTNDRGKLTEQLIISINRQRSVPINPLFNRRTASALAYERVAMMYLVASLAAIIPVDAPPAAAPDAPIIFAQLQIRVEQQSIIRIRPAPSALPEITAAPRWKEKGAPNCIKWSSMAAALVSSPTTIDLIIKGGTRFRVKLERSCSAVDFYSGFYVKNTPDGQVCRDRDMIHSRSGGECGIDRFRTLVPAK